MKCKKLLICILLFILIFCGLFITKSSAISVNCNGNIVDFPDIPEEAVYYVIFNSRGKIRLSYTTDINCTKVKINRSRLNQLCIQFLDDNNNLLQEKRFNMTDSGWIASGGGFDGNIGVTYGDLSIYLSNIDIYDIDNKLYYKPSYAMSLNYQEDNSYAQIVSGFFDISEYNNIDCYISSDNLDFVAINKEGAELGPDKNYISFLFWYNIQKNGTYYIKYQKKDGTILCTFKIIVDKIDENFCPLNLHLSSAENTTELYVVSDEFCFDNWDNYNLDDDFLMDYTVEVLTGIDEGYKPIYTITESKDDSPKYHRRYEYQIFNNGIYKFKITKKDDNSVYYKTFNIDNFLLKNQYGDDVYYNNYNEKGEFDPTPVLFLDYIDTSTVRIRTQPFTFNELLYLECYVSSDNENYERNNNIYKMTIDNKKQNYTYSYDQKSTSTDLYYFYYDVKVDGNYYFKFYNINLKKNTFGNIEVNIQKFLADNVDNIEKYPDRFVVWGNKHFGILIYPFNLIISLLGRINNITYVEPVLSIPELREPFNNYKICEATSFNFNNLLSNNTFLYIHNIYLIAVDVILIFLFIKFCKKTFEEIFGK